jgi:exodeoxyribonuclease V beta subunit
MAELMAHHHYPLQANLYLVALHRYLRWRLPDYRPERDLGGSVYVFLRGVPGPLEHGGRPDGPVPGMAVEPAVLERIEALDTLLREGVP